MRILIPIVAIAIAGCATTTAPPPPAKQDTEAEQKVLAERISRICALPEAEREVELEKLKKESGLVLYCGRQ